MKIDESVELAAWLLETLKEAKGFVLDQAPSFAQEIVQYGRIWHPLMVLLALAAIAAYIKWWYPRSRDAWINTNNEFHAIAGGVSGVVIGAVGIIVAVDNISPAIKAWIAPRLYLLDQVAQFLN